MNTVTNQQFMKKMPGLPGKSTTDRVAHLAPGL
jgi:hypothetical protein